MAKTASWGLIGYGRIRHDQERQTAPPEQPMGPNVGMDQETLLAWRMYRAGLACVQFTGLRRSAFDDPEAKFIRDSKSYLERKTPAGAAVYIGPAAIDRPELDTIKPLPSTEDLAYFGLWRPRPTLEIPLLADQFELIFVQEAKGQAA